MLLAGAITFPKIRKVINATKFKLNTLVTTILFFVLFATSISLSPKTQNTKSLEKNDNPQIAKKDEAKSPEQMQKEKDDQIAKDNAAAIEKIVKDKEESDKKLLKLIEKRKKRWTKKQLNQNILKGSSLSMFI
jgi:hypothetical protein